MNFGCTAPRPPAMVWGKQCTRLGVVAVLALLLVLGLSSWRSVVHSVKTFSNRDEPTSNTKRSILESRVPEDLDRQPAELTLEMQKPEEQTPEVKKSDNETKTLKWKWTNETTRRKPDWIRKTHVTVPAPNLTPNRTPPPHQNAPKNNSELLHCFPAIYSVLCMRSVHEFPVWRCCKSTKHLV